MNTWKGDHSHYVIEPLQVYAGRTAGPITKGQVCNKDESVFQRATSEEQGEEALDSGQVFTG